MAFITSGRISDTGLASGVSMRGDCNARVGDRRHQRVAHRLDGNAGEDPAVDDGLRLLRQGVLGMSRIEHRRHTGRARRAHELRRPGQRLRRGRVGRIGGEPPQRLADLARLGLPTAPRYARVRSLAITGKWYASTLSIARASW